MDEARRATGEAPLRPAAELVEEVERRLEQIESLPDQATREAATEALGALLELYGAGLERIVEVLAARDDGQLAEALAGDELVSHLLLLHGLHPVPLERRVLDALGEVRPYLESHGGNVELLEVAPPAVRLRLEGSCSGCPSSTMTLKLAIENAIRKAAPEIDEVVAEDAPEPAGQPLLQIELGAGMASSPAAPSPAAPPPAAGPAAELDGAWTMAGGLPDLAEGRPLVKEIAGQAIMFLKVSRRIYAYRPGCPACGESLEGAALNGFELRCAGCGARFDALRAGRSLDSPQLHLEPVPLLVGEEGLVKVALPVNA